MKTPLLLLVALILLVLGTVLPFIAGGQPLMPENIAQHGEKIDWQIKLTLIISGAIFALAQITLGVLVCVNRTREGRKAQYLHGNSLVEWGSILGSLFLFVSLNVYGQSTWIDMHMKEKDPSAVEVSITGLQYKWAIHYAGNDGKYGKTVYSKIKDDRNNWLGLDYRNKEAIDCFDDIQVLSPLKLPLDTPVVLLLKSRDVIHSFSVRELRVKQDAVPGLEMRIPFVINKEKTRVFSLKAAAYVADLERGAFTEKLQAAFEEHGTKFVQMVRNPESGKSEELKSTGKVAVVEAGSWWTVEVPERVQLVLGAQVYNVFKDGEALNVYKTRYEAACTELCGQGHWTMSTMLEVMPKAAFDRWLQKESAQNFTDRMDRAK